MRSSKLPCKTRLWSKLDMDTLSIIAAFVANTGGLLGLCMGFSLVSVFEILYHVLGALRKWWTTRIREPIDIGTRPMSSLDLTVVCLHFASNNSCYIFLKRRCCVVIWILRFPTFNLNFDNSKWDAYAAYLKFLKNITT